MSLKKHFPNSSWKTASEYYGWTQRDPLRGRRRLIKNEYGNAVRDEIASIFPTHEIIAAMGGTEEDRSTFFHETGKSAVIRVRADLIGFLKALCIRHGKNTGKEISLPNVLSLMALHGMHGVLDMSEFAQVSE